MDTDKNQIEKGEVFGVAGVSFERDFRRLARKAK